MGWPVGNDQSIRTIVNTVDSSIKRGLRQNFQGANPLWEEKPKLPRIVANLDSEGQML